MMLSRFTFAFCALLACLSLSSCNIAAPVFYILHGPPRTKAVYELADVPTVIFVDDRYNVIPRNADLIRRKIADRASVVLMQKEILVKTIRPQDAIAVARGSDKFSEVMPVDAVGRAVGAVQIIYVEMMAFSETAPDLSPRPSAGARVKIIDVANRERLFPAPDEDLAAYPLQYVMPPVSNDLYSSRSSRLQIHEMLAEGLGVELAKMFFDHETKELGSGLQ